MIDEILRRQITQGLNFSDEMQSLPTDFVIKYKLWQTEGQNEVEHAGAGHGINGCPVVAVDAGDLSTWMEVTSPDADELADKIEQVLMEDCKTILPQKFHLDSVSDSWRQLLESL